MSTPESLRTTPEELLIHLREAGARRVLVSRDAFSDGTVSVTATYPAGGTSGFTAGLIRDVFDAVGHELWFLGSPWRLLASIEPSGPDQHDDRLPLFDATMAAKHGEGLNLWNLYFVYEAHRAERHSGSNPRHVESNTRRGGGPPTRDASSHTA